MKNITSLYLLEKDTHSKMKFSYVLILICVHVNFSYP